MAFRTKVFRVYAFFLNDAKYKWALCDTSNHTLKDKSSDLEYIQRRALEWNTALYPKDDKTKDRYEVFRVLYCGSGYEYVVCDNEQSLVLAKFRRRKEAEDMARKWNKDNSHIMVDLLNLKYHQEYN